MRNFSNNVCKICLSKELEFVEHTAKCSFCGVLLYYPYPDQDKPPEVNFYEWYSLSFEKNINNFRDITLYSTEKSLVKKPIKVLDYGGASGQFALIFKSLFPKADVYIVDIVDESLFDEYKSINKQIKFSEFKEDETKFDIIFLNDVYEHVEDPVALLKNLYSKLTTGGKIFIDTPRQFWIYPFFKLILKPIYNKILKGTVSKSHLQIWSKKSFNMSVALSGLKIKKVDYFSELTMDTSVYLRQMNLDYTILRLFVKFFAYPLIYTFKNKIYAILEKN